MVDANVLLILGTEYQNKWGMRIDPRRQEIYIRKSQDRLKKDKEMSHWTIPIQRQKQLREEAKNLAHMMNTKTGLDHELRKHIMKINKILCHRSKEQLDALVQSVEKDTPKIKGCIKNVCSTCTICKMLGKTPTRPRTDRQTKQGTLRIIMRMVTY